MKETELKVRANRIAPVFWGWIILFGVDLGTFIIVALYRGALVKDWSVIFLWGFTIPGLFLMSFWYYTRFPIITIKDGVLRSQIFWEKREVQLPMIKQIVKKTGFAAKPILRCSFTPHDHIGGLKFTILKMETKRTLILT